MNLCSANPSWTNLTQTVNSKQVGEKLISFFMGIRTHNFPKLIQPWNHDSIWELNWISSPSKPPYDILVFCYLPYARLTDIFLRSRTQLRKDDIDLFETTMMAPEKKILQIKKRDCAVRWLASSDFSTEPPPINKRALVHCELPFLCRQTQSGNYPL